MSLTTFQKKDRVAAHPTNTIKLDEGGANEYTLPTDATRLTEDRLISDVAFNGYKQNDGFLLNPTKINVKAFSTVQPRQYYEFSEKTDKDRVLAAGLVSTWGNGVSYDFSTTFLFLLDENNNLLDSRQLEGTSINQTHGGYGTEISYLQKKPDGTFLILSGNKTVTVKLNAAETSIASVTPGSLTFLGAAPNEMSYNCVQIGLDNKIYYSGHWYQTAETPSTVNNGRMIGILNTNGNEERRVRLKYTQGSSVFADPNFMRIEQLSGMKKSPNNQELLGIMTYMSKGGTSYSKLVTWDKDGNMLRQYVPAVGSVTIKPLNKISSTDERYFLVKDNSKSEIVKYTAATGFFTKVAEFPANTDMEIIRLGDGSYSAIGYLATVTGVFSPFNEFLKVDSTFVANLSSSFAIKSAVGMETGLNKTLNIRTASFLDNSRYFFSGTFSELNVSSIPATSFIDGFQSALGANAAWTNKSPGATHGEQNIFGILETKQDHKPAMYAPDNIIYNVEDRTLNQPSTVNTQYKWSVRDNWLITGTKNGALTSPMSIRVYDVYDTELSLSPQPNSLHYNRINRNPLNVANAMEWTKLGLNESNPGPQLLTYFVSDTQRQTTTRSRWINKITDETKKQTSTL